MPESHLLLSRLASTCRQRHSIGLRPIKGGQRQQQQQQRAAISTYTYGETALRRTTPFTVTLPTRNLVMGRDIHSSIPLQRVHKNTNTSEPAHAMVRIPDLFVSWASQAPRVNQFYEKVRPQVEGWFRE